MLDFIYKQAKSLNYIKLEKIRSYLERSESIKKFAKLILNSALDIIELYKNAMNFKNTIGYLVSKFNNLSSNKQNKTILSAPPSRKNRVSHKQSEYIFCGLPFIKNINTIYLNNPMVYMFKLPNDNETSEVSKSYVAHTKQTEQKTKIENDLSLVEKAKTELSHSTKNSESFETVKSKYEAFFDEESENDSLQGLDQLEEYLNDELKAINKKLNSIEKDKPNYLETLKKKRQL